MNFNHFLRQTLTDIKVKLEGEFKQNFERKAFFNEKWKETKFPNRRGSLMMRTGNLRASIQSKIQGNSIVFSSSMPYADIQNNGGEIKVTAQMKKYFWAMAVSHGGQKGKKSAEYERWKALALKKVGDTIRIEKRPFIGNHPRVETIIKRYFFVNVGKYLKSLDFKKL